VRSARAQAALAGREFVVPDDVHAVAVPVLAHRLVLTAEALAARRSPADLIRGVLQRVVVPHGNGQVSQPVSGPNGRWLGGMRPGR
jgi:MoxR-like ATPase